MKRGFIVLGVIFSVFGWTVAQPLDSLLYLAGENNPSLRAGNLYYQALRQREIQARQWPEPEFKLDFIAFPFPNRTFMPSASFGVMQAIPWKGVREGNAALAVAEAQIAFEDIRMAQLELRFRIKEAYWQLFELEKSREVVGENLSLLKSWELLIQTRIETGTATMGELLEIRMLMLDLGQQMEQLSNAQRNPRATINALLNRPQDTPIEVREAPDAPALFAFEADAFKEASKDYPGITALEHEKTVSRQKQMLIRLERKPSIVAGLDYLLMNTGEGIHATDGRDMLMPGIGVRLPVFRQTYAARDEEERLRQASLADRQKEVENALVAAVEQARTAWEDARIQFQTAKDQIPLYASAIRLVETGLAAGTADFEKSLRLSEGLLSVKIREIQSIAKSFIAVAALERWTE